MDVYERLREILDAHPSGAPKSKAFDEILRILFTGEEAELAIHMSFSPKLAHEIASARGIPVDEAEYLLESMADKAVIFSREKDRKDGLGDSFAGNPTPMARVVPVRHAIDATVHIHPYDEVSKLIEKADYIALGHCACRVSVGACRSPKEVCLFFDAPARFLVERRFARAIGREEAHNVLDRAEETGLAHTSSNSADRASFTCNCCPCCCISLTSRTRLNLAHGFSTSGFQPQVDSSACTGCQVCADERCPVSAADSV